MLIKMLGSVAVLVSCSGIGLWYGNTLTMRIQQLKELRAEVLLIRGDIRYRRSSLPEAFAEAAIRSKGMFQPLFRGISEALAACVWESFEEAYRSVAETALRETDLKRQDEQLLAQFAKMLGQMDADMQLNALDWYLEQSEQVLQGLTAEAEGKVRLGRSLGILSGIFLLVVLL
ncbi:MAG: stage III sporulation protein AB [Lachnospiraceae bacterium]|nr:stage III sporulation protein AB [Lachnospiraceae bacterium]